MGWGTVCGSRTALRQSLLDYSHPRPPRHRRVIFTPGRAVFAPNCFVELALSLRLVPELLTWGGSQSKQLVELRAILRWAGPPARGVNREINTARATGDTQCATNNRRVTRHSRHTWLIGPQQLELLFNLRWHSTRPRRNAVLSNETKQKCSQKNNNF